MHPTALYGHLPIADLSWPQYVQILSTAHAAWGKVQGEGVGVFGEGETWERAIRAGHAAASKSDWQALEDLEADALTGDGARDPAFALLGGAAAPESVAPLFRGDDMAAQRQDVHAELSHLREVPPSAFPQAAARCLEALTRGSRIDAAAATRLIALARPDCGVSVNRASRKRLARLSGVPEQGLLQPAGYRTLLEWVQEQPWHAAPAPQEAQERAIWEMRAALIDVLVSDPRSAEAAEDAPAPPTGSVMDPGLRTIQRSVALAVSVADSELGFYLNQALPAVGGEQWWASCVLDAVSGEVRETLERQDAATVSRLPFSDLLQLFVANWELLATAQGLPPSVLGYALEALDAVTGDPEAHLESGDALEHYRLADTLHRLIAAVQGDPHSLKQMDKVRRTCLAGVMAL